MFSVDMEKVGWTVSRHIRHVRGGQCFLDLGGGFGADPVFEACSEFGGCGLFVAGSSAKAPGIEEEEAPKPCRWKGEAPGSSGNGLKAVDDMIPCHRCPSIWSGECYVSTVLKVA